MTLVIKHSDVLNHQLKEFGRVAGAKQGKRAPELLMCGQSITNTDLTVMIKSVCTGVFPLRERTASQSTELKHTNS